MGILQIAFQTILYISNILFKYASVSNILGNISCEIVVIFLQYRFSYLLQHTSAKVIFTQRSRMRWHLDNIKCRILFKYYKAYIQLNIILFYECLKHFTFRKCLLHYFFLKMFSLMYNFLKGFSFL